MFKYDASQYDPPAPVASVTLRNSATGAAADNIELLLDTGADATLLPRAAVARLGVEPLPDLQYELMGFDGSRSLASVAIMDMVFLGRTYRGRYLLIDADHGILGRDVINHLILLLDGPKQQWSQPT
ncbi:MAG: retropepsin-like aspartic protease [Pirellulales bacterium]